MNRRSVLLSAGAVLGGCASAIASRQTHALSADFDAALTRGMAKLAVVPGLSVAVYARNEVYVRAIGVADVLTGHPVTPDTAFYIASATKSFTALALAISDASDDLDLDIPLSAFAREARFPASVRPAEVRLRDLLTHTSGIENAAISFRLAFTGQHDPETLWRLLESSGPNANAPLGAFEYTNVGYNIATLLTDRQIGVPWQDLLERAIFQPAGMRRTSARISRASVDAWSLARPHYCVLPGGPVRIALEKTDQTMHSAGGLIMSANDALRWLELMIEDGRVGGRRVVPAGAVRLTRAPLVAVRSESEGYARDHYGLGWYIGRYREESLVHQFGNFAGFSAHVSYLRDRPVGVAVFVNDESVGAPLVHAIANYIYDRTANREDAEETFDAAIIIIMQRRDDLIGRGELDRANRASRAWNLARSRAAYAGAYENERLGRMEVGVDGETMSVRFGALRSVAEPFTRPNSIRVELVPFRGAPILFEGDGPTPSTLVFEGERFVRR